MITYFNLFENQINIVKKGIIPVKRYCSYDRENTDELRCGTWYSYLYNDIGDRYKDGSNVGIGGEHLITGNIKCINPATITCDAFYVLSDPQMFERLSLFKKSDKDILYNVLDSKNLIRYIKDNNLIPDNIDITKISDFNLSNIIADRLLYNRLIENNYDCFIWLDEKYDIHEIFDFKQKFIKNK